MVTERVLCRIEGHVAEVEYINEDGDVVGFWAYGSWHPDYPYQGEVSKLFPAKGKLEKITTKPSK